MAIYKKAAYVCEVVEAEGGKLGYRLLDGDTIYKSPSAAGMAVTKHSCVRLDGSGACRLFFASRNSPLLQNIFPGAPGENWVSLKG